MRLQCPGTGAEQHLKPHNRAALGTSGTDQWACLESVLAAPPVGGHARQEVGGAARVDLGAHDAATKGTEGQHDEAAGGGRCRGGADHSAMLLCCAHASTHPKKAPPKFHCSLLPCRLASVVGTASRVLPACDCVWEGSSARGQHSKSMHSSMPGRPIHLAWARSERGRAHPRAAQHDAALGDGQLLVDDEGACRRGG